MNGKDVRLAEFRGRPDHPELLGDLVRPLQGGDSGVGRAGRAVQGQNLTVLGVSVDDSPEDLRKFAADYKINYPVLVGLGQDKFQETYDAVMVIPVTWFIRADGTIHLKHQGPATREWLETQVKAMLAPAR